MIHAYTMKYKSFYYNIQSILYLKYWWRLAFNEIRSLTYIIYSVNR